MNKYLIEVTFLVELEAENAEDAEDAEDIAWDMVIKHPQTADNIQPSTVNAI